MPQDATPRAAPPTGASLAGATPKRARRGWARAAVILAELITGIALLVVLAIGGMKLRLQAGPIEAPFLGSRIERAFEAALGEGSDLVLGPVRIVDAPGGPKVTVEGVKLFDHDGALVLNAPRAEATINPLAALRGEHPARRFTVVGLELRLESRADGALTLSLGPDDAKPIAFGGASAGEAGRAPFGEALAAAAGALIDLGARAQGPLGELEHVAIEQGRLKVVDSHGRLVADDRDVSIAFDRDPARGEARLRISAAGRKGVWSAAASSDAKARRLNVSVQGLSSDEIALAAGFRARPVDFDMPLSASASVAVTKESKLASASGRFAFGAGKLHIVEPPEDLVQIDQLSGGFHWEAGTRAIVVERTRLRAGQTDLSLEGRMTPLDAASRNWALEFHSTGNVLSPETRADKAVSIGDMKMSGRYALDEGALAIDRLNLEGPDVSILAAAELIGGAAGPAARLALKARRMNARDFLRFWPTPVSPETRAWFMASFHGGVLERGDLTVAMDPKTILSQPGGDIPDAAVSLSFDVSGATLDYLPGATPLTNISGRGHIGGRSAVFDARHAELQVSDTKKLIVSDARFEAPDFGPDPVKAQVTARVQGPLDGLVDYLSRPAFKPFVKLPGPARGARGQIDARLTLDLELGQGARPPRARLEAQATNAVIENFLGSEKLEGASLAIQSDGAGLRVKGEGRAFAAPAQIDLHASGDKGEANVALTFDDAARARRGLAAPGLSGPVVAKISAPLADLGRAGKAQVDLDFAGARFAGLFGALNKAAGKPAKASFVLTRSDAGASLDNLTFEGAGALAKGAANLDAEGALKWLKLTQLRLSPGDDMRLEAQREPDVYAVAVRGAALDARPFLKAFGEAGGGSGDALTRGLDLNLETTLLTGYNKQAIGSAKLRMTRAGGRIGRFSLTGAFGRDPVRVALAEDGTGFDFSTRDAGSALAFLDIYPKMEGGSMAGVAHLKGPRVDADFEIRGFALRDEPAVRRLVAETAVARNDPSLARRIDARMIRFERLEASLTKTPDRLEVHDAVLSGPNVGLTVSGVIDANNRMSMTGSFVPAYAINNFFAKLPLLGPILGGGSNEGLFALNFRLTGPMANPNVQINPLSAIAPGMFRRIFSFDGSQKAVAPPDRASQR